MPRPPEQIKLTTDDLKRFIAGENGEIKAKVIKWAKGELARRKKAGKAGGRPRTRTKRGEK
jgi:hypothetical protein